MFYQRIASQQPSSPFHVKNCFAAIMWPANTSWITETCKRTDTEANYHLSMNKLPLVMNKLSSYCHIHKKIVLQRIKKNHLIHEFNLPQSNRQVKQARIEQGQTVITCNYLILGFQLRPNVGRTGRTCQCHLSWCIFHGELHQWAAKFPWCKTKVLGYGKPVETCDEDL